MNKTAQDTDVELGKMMDDSGNDGKKDRTGELFLSVVVPAYNAEDSIGKTLQSLKLQTLSKKKFEIIVVDDGSSDNTLQVCRNYANEMGNLTVVHQEQSGVSRARNNALDLAKGRYIAFLDSDDTFEPETLKSAVSFFDKHYEETDIVVLSMVIIDEKGEHPHVRELVLDHTGVYDLTKLDNAFALVTNVNVLVKNNEELPRFDECISIHEDNLFLTTIILRKQTVGFSKKGGYRYFRGSNSATATKMHPFYHFEDTIRLWENLFEPYDGDAPIYLQASYLNELNWKLKSDKLFPYHYETAEYKAALSRISSLVSRVSCEVISQAPRMDGLIRAFFLKWSKAKEVSCYVGSIGVAFVSEGSPLFYQKFVDMHVCETIVTNGCLTVKGYLKSPAFDFLGKPDLVAVADGYCNSIEISPSSHCRHQSHVVTTTAWDFEFSICLEKDTRVVLEVMIDDVKQPIKIHFSNRARFNYRNRILCFIDNETAVWVNPTRKSLTVQHITDNGQRQKVFEIINNVVKQVDRATYLKKRKLFTRRNNKPIWLYYDRSEVGKDNAFYQFLHDMELDDGIDRYYVTDNEDILEEFRLRKLSSSIVRFSSDKHETLHVLASRLIVSYLEKPNWCPFETVIMERLVDMISYDIVYLQHGVLHAHMPWKYSADRLFVDYEVISTQFERDSLTHTYGFREMQLIPSGMPRYDFIDIQCSRKKKILYAPTWRGYLLEATSSLQFSRLASFSTSDYWIEVSRFLGNPDFTQWLEKNDYILEIQLHPIFRVYESDFSKLLNPRIQLASNNDIVDYELVITDYSSLVFDFVYQRTPILYFVPDYNEFKAGLNAYHELDLPLEEAFGPIAETATELFRQMVKMHATAFELGSYASRYDNFFLHYDNQQRSRLYKALMQLDGIKPACLMSGNAYEDAYDDLNLDSFMLSGELCDE